METMKHYKAIIYDIDNTLLNTLDMNMYPLMRIIKEEQPKIDEQVFDNLCMMRLSIRKSRADVVEGRLRKVEGATVEITE